MNIFQLEKKAKEIRRMMFRMCVDAGKGHVTSCLSCIEILVAMYYEAANYDSKNPDWGDRDRIIISKGQCSPALYCILADLGFFNKEELKGFTKLNGKLGVHLQRGVPSISMTIGSLGQGFGIAAGIALAAKMNRKLYTVYTLLGDGECYEGSIWETAMFASHNNLNNLVTIIDRNYQCVTDFTENLIELAPLEDKWKSFGFNVIKINGHSFDELLESLGFLKNKPHRKPTVIIADTVKGKGVDLLCHDPLWHGRTPIDKELVNDCFKELESYE